jgi:hypothetical protein
MSIPEMLEQIMMARIISLCDKRIACAQEKLLLLISLEKEISNESNQLRIQNCENDLKLLQTEKLIYKAVGNPNSTSAIFPLLLSKYDELLCASYDFSKQLVICGVCLEREYLAYCSDSLEQRNYIETVCQLGQKQK